MPVYHRPHMDMESVKRMVSKQYPSCTLTRSANGVCSLTTKAIRDLKTADRQRRTLTLGLTAKEVVPVVPC